MSRWCDFVAILDFEPALDLLVYTRAELAALQAADNPLVTCVLDEGVLVHDSPTRDGRR